MQLEYLDLEDACIPKDGFYRVMCDYWWIVTQDNQIMYCSSSAQANTNKSIAEYIKNKMYPNSRLEQLPTVYIPISIQEYNYKPFN